MKGKYHNQLRQTVKNLKMMPFVDAVLLFGSYRSGAHTPLSDIDICVVDNMNYPLREREKVFDENTKSIQISLFSQLSLIMKYEVLRGRPLFIRNKKAFYELKENVILEYLDFRYVLGEHYRIKKEIGKCVLTV